MSTRAVKTILSKSLRRQFGNGKLVRQQSPKYRSMNYLARALFRPADDFHAARIIEAALLAAMPALLASFSVC